MTYCVIDGMKVRMLDIETALKAAFSGALERAGAAREKAKQLRFQKLLDTVLDTCDYILIDDAQDLFEWDIVPLFVKDTEHFKARVIFFAPTPPDMNVLNPAVPATLDWDDLRLNAEEESSLCERFMECVTTDCVLSLTPRAINWLLREMPSIKEDCGGHPGLLRHTLQF
jgi:hypothetical protein